MRLIGYWLRDLKDEEFCAPQEVVGDMPEDVRTKVADYLDAGAVDLWHSQWGYSWCRFFCGIPSHQMGSSELTDGRWRWPAGLSHYVRAHGIVLPDEFIAHALAYERGNALQPVAEDELDYWRGWCAAHRSPAFLQHLRQARAVADVRAEVFEQEEMRRRISREVTRYGLGQEPCIFAGCSERVLSGMKLCARHILMDERHVADVCYSIRKELFA